MLIPFGQLSKRVVLIHLGAKLMAVYSDSDWDSDSDEDSGSDEDTSSGSEQDNSNITDNDTFEDHYWVEDPPSFSLRPNHFLVYVYKISGLYTVVIKDNHWFNAEAHPNGPGYVVNTLRLEGLEADAIRAGTLLVGLDVDAAFLKDVMEFLEMCRLQTLDEDPYSSTMLVGPAGVRYLGDWTS